VAYIYNVQAPLVTHLYSYDLHGCLVDVINDDMLIV